MTSKVYKTANGKTIDMGALMLKNENVRAVGNMKVNARGDELGAGGQIIRKREDVVAEYYEENPNARGSRVAPAPAPEPLVGLVDKVPELPSPA